MSRYVKKTSHKKGLPPGSLVFVGNEKQEKIRIRIFNYDEENLKEIEVNRIEEVFPFKEQKTTTWINVDGLHRTEVIESIGKHYDIHPLILEDILNTNQRPKMEETDNNLFIVLKMLDYDAEKNEINSEQVSFILVENCVISFQEREGDVFDHLRERLRQNVGKVRKMQADYLTYLFLDAVIDNYFVILEKLGDKIEDLEEKLIANPSKEMMEQIHNLKREIIFLRKSIWPLRDVINGLERSESPLIKKSTEIYLRDLYDHTIQVIDTVETFRDIVTGMMDLYLTSVSNRMNEVMKVLTIFAAIFIPLTFLAGVYGMNFKYMPELNWKFAYPIWWGISIIAGLLMLAFFKKKKWL
ncbi:MAG: magnesium/cobalt transporter CorA [Candidatus Cloacimonetes bacterium]|nr:magnesium/cobalt transporter CorA [Candidatus Cloacimonadota bacterium]